MLLPTMGSHTHFGQQIVSHVEKHEGRTSKSNIPIRRAIQQTHRNNAGSTRFNNKWSLRQRQNHKSHCRTLLLAWMGRSSPQIRNIMPQLSTSKG